MSKDIKKREMTLPELLNAKPADLTEEQIALRSNYLQAVAEEKEEVATIAKPDRLEVAHQQQLFKLPNGEASDNVDILILGFVKTRGAWSGSGDDSKQICSSIGNVVGRPTKEAAEFGYMNADRYLKLTNPLCINCPLNQWDTALDDSGKQTKGKYCKEMRRNLVIVKGYERGLQFNITVSNLKAYDKYRQDMENKGNNVCGLWTNVKAIEEKAGKKVWSTFVFTEGEPITVEEFALADEIRTKFKESIQKEVETEDYFGKTDDDLPSFNVENDVEDDEPPVHGDEDYRKPEKPQEQPLHAKDDDDDLPF